MIIAHWAVPAHGLPEAFRELASLLPQSLPHALPDLLLDLAPRPPPVRDHELLPRPVQVALLFEDGVQLFVDKAGDVQILK